MPDQRLRNDRPSDGGAGLQRVPAGASGFRAFVIVWAGQFVSLLGSGLSGFALGLYVYQLTGSATALGVVFTLGLLPSIVVAPFAGSLVDRWGSRQALLVSNMCNLVITVVLAAVLITGTFALWHVYVVVALGSVVAALEIPAIGALAPQLVTKEQLGRVNGMRMLAMAASGILAPVLGGFLLLAIGIGGIIVIDAVTFAVAILTLYLVRVPRAARPDGQPRARVRILLVEAGQGWHYITARPGLLALLLFLGGVNFSAGFIDLLITPLVLGFADSSALGTVLSIGGLGIVCSSVAISIGGAPRRRVRWILGISLVLGIATVVGALRPDVVLVAVAAFMFMAALGVIISLHQSIWQTKVEQHLMGRVISIVSMVGQIPQLLAYAAAGVAVEAVFEPIVGRDDVRSPELAALIGTGPGRGVALLMMVMGVLILVTVAVAALNPRLRGLEGELPDVTPADADGGSDGPSDPPVETPGATADAEPVRDRR
jgi:DHA3 family macrolide efflux protein-like MFS transporter